MSRHLSKIASPLQRVSCHSAAAPHFPRFIFPTETCKCLLSHIVTRSPRIQPLPPLLAKRYNTTNTQHTSTLSSPLRRSAERVKWVAAPLTRSSAPLSSRRCNQYREGTYYCHSCVYVEKNVTDDKEWANSKQSRHIFLKLIEKLLYTRVPRLYQQKK